MIDLHSIGSRFKVMDTDNPDEISTVQVVAQGELEYLLRLPTFDISNMSAYFDEVESIGNMIKNKVSSPWSIVWMQEDTFNLDDVASNLHGEYALVILSDDLVNTLYNQ